MLTRRQFTVMATCGGASTLTPTPSAWAQAPGPARHIATLRAELRKLEADAQGRLGVYMRDTATGQTLDYRADERFMMLSSFKLLASALVLHRVDAGLESLERRIPYGPQDLIPWSPITEKHADGQGMTLAQLCEATLTTSDNTAANLILASCGGPPAWTAFARQLGDPVSRLDRNEPTLNTPTAEGLRDTTSPRAMAHLMQQVLLGSALSASTRALLLQWLRHNTTGKQRLQAGLPADWRIGDKTGTNPTDANDIAIMNPPQRAPLLVTAYLADSPVSSKVKEATLAAVGRLAHALARAA